MFMPPQLRAGWLGLTQFIPPLLGLGTSLLVHRESLPLKCLITSALTLPVCASLTLQPSAGRPRTRRAHLPSLGRPVAPLPPRRLAARRNLSVAARPSRIWRPPER